MNEIPRRPFTELTPPSEGLSAVRGAARQRRRIKTAVTSTAGAGALAVVLALVSGSGFSGDDSLHVVTPAHSQDPTPGSVTATPESTEPATQPSEQSTPTQAPPASIYPGMRTTEQPSTEPSPGSETAAYETPDLKRAYTQADQSLVFGGTNACVGTTYGDTSPSAQNTVDWCYSAIVTPIRGGHLLAAELCRDGTSGNQLTYSTAREVDLEVKQAGKTVWRWSTGHSFADTGHVLQVAADHCWTWSLTWTDVDNNGKPLSKGDYELWVNSSAAEMRSHPDQSQSFTL